MIVSSPVAKAANSTLHPTAGAGVRVGKGKGAAPAAGERGRWAVRRTVADNSWRLE